jgi:hypothetical protein
MDDWITLGEGKYLAQTAYLVSQADKAIELENAFIEIYKGAGGKRYLRGRSNVRNMLVVMLLEDSDDLDIIIDLGPSHKYLFEKPEVKAGKVFSPDVKSRLQFVPSVPWQPLTEEAYRQRIDGLEIIPDP